MTNKVRYAVIFDSTAPREKLEKFLKEGRINYCTLAVVAPTLQETFLQAERNMLETIEEIRREYARKERELIAKYNPAALWSDCG